MNILHVISSANPLGGGPIEGIRQLGTTLTKAGNTIEIASLDPPGAPFLAQFPLPVHPLGPGVLKYAFSPRLVPWLRANRGRYDAVIVNGIWQFNSFAVWQALHNSSTPYVVFTHGMLDPWFKRNYPLKHLKKWMYWPWGDYRVLRDASAVLFTSEEERVLARRSFWLYQCNEVVVSYGTAQPKGDPKAELEEFFGHYPALRGKRLAFFLGRIHPKKGCDLLIQAFAEEMKQDPAWQLVIAGPDQVQWQEKLVEMARHLGVEDRITWTGMLTGTRKWGALRASEIFVLPSHQENFGIVVAEALAVGTPVLISDQVNIWREIQEDGAGLVAADTLEGTRNLLRGYLNLDEEKKAALRRSAVECFQNRFEIVNAAGTLSRVLAGVRGVN